MVMAGEFTFGAFPLGMSGTPDGLATGPPDDFERIRDAMERLQGDGDPLLVRMYVAWFGVASTESSLSQVAGLANARLPWELALVYRDEAGDVDAWTEFVASVVRDYGHRFDVLQVTGEANLKGIPSAADGAFPRATEAVVKGVLAAADAKRHTGAEVAVGFAAVPEVDPASGEFWPALSRLGGAPFADAIDFAGLDMYPDVFGPRGGLEELDRVVDWLLRSFREQAMPAAGLDSSVPIRICENGWPTGPDRPEELQADVLETVLKAIHARRDELGVRHWSLFTLRDADSSRDDMFFRFGILRSDYSEKPAFDRLVRVIAELRGGDGAPAESGS
jgi:hypothetical protein